MVSLFITVCEWPVCSEPSVITRLHTVGLSVQLYSGIAVGKVINLFILLIAFQFSSVQFKMVSMR